MTELYQIQRLNRTVEILSKKIEILEDFLKEEGIDPNPIYDANHVKIFGE
jgi:predicted HTH domain antitoxin